VKYLHIIKILPNFLNAFCSGKILTVKTWTSSYSARSSKVFFSLQQTQGFNNYQHLFTLHQNDHTQPIFSLILLLFAVKKGNTQKLYPVIYFNIHEKHNVQM